MCLELHATGRLQKRGLSSLRIHEVTVFGDPLQRHLQLARKGQCFGKNHASTNAPAKHGEWTEKAKGSHCPAMLALAVDDGNDLLFFYCFMLVDAF